MSAIVHYRHRPKRLRKPAKPITVAASVVTWRVTCP